MLLSYTLGYKGDNKQQRSVTDASEVEAARRLGQAAAYGGRTLSFELRKGVEWSDGTTFTSADVAFSFDLIKKYPALNSNDASFLSVRTEGPYKVVFTLAHPDYPQIVNIGSTYIVPEHIWAKVNPLKFSDPDPVGTGPYVLKSFSSADVLLTKNTHYWQRDEPKIAELSFPEFTSGSAIDAALSAGEFTWGGQYIPDIQKTYIARDPKYRHYWFAPLGVVSLFPNLTVYPLNNVKVREAISDAIDRQAVSIEGESGYEAPATSPTGLVLPYDNSLLLPQYKNLRFSVNDAKARGLLKQAGLKMGQGGYFLGKDGRPLTLTIVDPSGFPDYMTDAQIIASDLKAIGLKVNVSGVSVPAWTSDYYDGDFQLTILWSDTGPSPYYAYNGWLNDSLSAPVGKAATGDFERFYSATAQSALSTYVTGLTHAARAAGVMEAEKVMVQDLPVIPLVYSAVWFEYDNRYVVGWPTPSNPYALGEPGGVEAEVVALHLRER